MLRRQADKLAFQGLEPAKDRERLLRMVGLNHLDEATLLGALLETSAILKPEGSMEAIHNKGREALRVLHQRKNAK
ncbi:MAG: conjugal transfer protein TraD [Rhodospirillaceae bacterium]|nr:conjugal transfer protein TraD [Rhodospirillaceae bacterium]